MSFNISKSLDSIIFGVTYVTIFSISKFEASIVISTLLGISNFSLDIPKLSCIPGNVIPIRVVLFPLSIILPFLISIFLLFSLFIIVPHTTTNGVYNVSFFPFIFTTCLSLFVYSIVIFTFPDFPAISFADTSFPSSSYLIVHSIGNSF